MEFYLVSGEGHAAYGPRRCRIVQRLRNRIRDDLALVQLDAPLPESLFPSVDGWRVILASRHEGSSLFPIKRWPTHVYVCTLQRAIEPSDSEIDDAASKVADLGSIYPAEEEALAAFEVEERNARTSQRIMAEWRLARTTRSAPE